MSAIYLASLRWASMRQLRNGLDISVASSIVPRMRQYDLWERLTVPMAYLIAGLVAAGAAWLAGFPGVLAVISIGVAYQVWWRWRHGRWMTDADWMEDGS